MSKKPLLSRRRALQLIAGLSVTSGALVYDTFFRDKASVFIGKAPRYDLDLKNIIQRGLSELGVTEAQLKGKRVLLKPNLVEPHAGKGHINTHPLVVRAAAETFLGMGASVVVAEGAGHRRDSYLVLEESGLADVLFEDKLPFFDLNTGPIHRTQNLGNFTKLGDLWLPDLIRDSDFVVSIAKMKTHHWAGVTLSMKNLFGVMPSIVYGWPKNVLHFAGIQPSILDIVSTVKPSLAIVDGIVGMEGDGPIMGDPVSSGVLVMGRSPIAVDATCCRVMGIDPGKVPYLKAANHRMGVIEAARIEQRGEPPESVRRDFKLLDFIEAQRGIRLA